MFPGGSITTAASPAETLGLVQLHLSGLEGTQSVSSALASPCDGVGDEGFMRYPATRSIYLNVVEV